MENQDLFNTLVDRGITTIEQWLQFDCTLKESVNAWLISTASGPKVRMAVYKHFEDMGYTLN